jgi:hypothetical protein
MSATDETVFQQQNRARPAAAEDRDSQQRAVCDAGEVRVAGEAVVADGIVEDQRFRHPLDVSQHGHRDSGFVAGTARRGGGGGAARHR